MLTSIGRFCGLTTQGASCTTPVSGKNKNKGRINFTSHLHPFVQLLSTIGTPIFKVSSFITQCASRTSTAIQEVSYRLVYQPDFNPKSREFKELITSFEERMSTLEERIKELGQKFSQKHLLTQDIQELTQLSFGIHETAQQLVHYSKVLGERPHPLSIQKKVFQIMNKYDLSITIQQWRKNKDEHNYAQQTSEMRKKPLFLQHFFERKKFKKERVVKIKWTFFNNQ